MASEPIKLNIATAIDPAALSAIEEYARAMAGIIDVFAAVAQIAAHWGRPLDWEWLAFDRPNAVPILASPWRKRYERRHYGRELTRDERDTRWRLMWGGLA